MQFIYVMFILCENFSLLSLTHLRLYEGGGVNLNPPPADFKHLQTSPLIGLNMNCLKSDCSKCIFKVKQHSATRNSYILVCYPLMFICIFVLYYKKLNHHNQSLEHIFFREFHPLFMLFVCLFRFSYISLSFFFLFFSFYFPFSSSLILSLNFFTLTFF